MVKPTKNETVQGQYFHWILATRQGTYYADGRSNRKKLKRYSLGVTSRQEALEELKDLDLKMAVELELAPRSLLQEIPIKLSLADGIKKYMGNLRGKQAMENISSTTLKRYRPVFDKFSKFCGEENVSGWQQVTSQTLNSYAAWLEKKDYAYRTRYFELTTLKQVVKFLIDLRDLPESNRIILKLTKNEETDTYCYTPEEVQAILALCLEAPDLRWFHDVLFTLTYTGMRISELASLRWTDLDFEKKFITLTDERYRAARGKSKERRRLKGKRSRSFPIHPDLQTILEAIPRTADGLVFHGPKGARIKPDRVRRLLIKRVLKPLAARFPTPAGEARGFEDGRIHSFRHYFCSMCANNRVPEQALKRWLGHRDSRMIQLYYHLHDAASHQAMQEVQFVPTAAKENSD